MSIKVNVACPICHQTISYQHEEPEAWGSLSAWDYGIVEITGHDKGLIAEHKNTHTFEEWSALQKTLADNLSARVARFA